MLRLEDFDMPPLDVVHYSIKTAFGAEVVGPAHSNLFIRSGQEINTQSSSEVRVFQSAASRR
jgi:hypothetical protein